MTEFKKGDRVRLAKASPIQRTGEEGTVAGPDPCYGTGRTPVDWDNGNTWDLPPTASLELIDAPLRFEDVRTGDQITVEVEDRFTLTGTAIVNPDKSVDVDGAGWRFTRQPDGSWSTNYSLIKATLTAHTPAEPEWHRAKVIKADEAAISVDQMESEYLTRNNAGMFVDKHGDQWPASKLSNVKIIVDEHGQVRS